MNSYLEWSAKGKAGGWRYLFGSVVLLILLFAVAGQEDLFVGLFLGNPKNSVAVTMLGTAFAFGIAFFAILLLVRLLHKRPFWSVAMPRWEFLKWDFWIGFLIGLIVTFVSPLVFGFIGLVEINFNPDFSMISLAAVALTAFVGLFFQAGSEELLFRGYFTQFARRFTANKFLFIGIPAFIFAAPHMLNISQVGGGILLILPYLIPALVFGWAAYRTGTLWLPLGLHLSNNYVSVVLLGTREDVLPSAAPLLMDFPSLPVIVAIITVQSVVLVATLEFLIQRRNSKQSI
jgi:membrane protease YdiL (CAAX protease family)